MAVSSLVEGGVGPGATVPLLLTGGIGDFSAASDPPTYSNERDRGVWLSWAFSGFRKRNQRKTLD